MYCGRFADAAELVREFWGKQTTETISGARKFMAPLAASLAARVLRTDFLAEITADEMIERAFDSADNEIILYTTAGYAEWFAANNERTRARELIARALAVIGDHAPPHPDYDVAYAQYGDAAAARWAHDVLARWAAPASNRVGQAYLALVTAIVLKVRSSKAARFARTAAEGFRDAGLPYYEALALERCGNQKHALEILSAHRGRARRTSAGIRDRPDESPRPQGGGADCARA